MLWNAARLHQCNSITSGLTLALRIMWNSGYNKVLLMTTNQVLIIFCFSDKSGPEPYVSCCTLSDKGPKRDVQPTVLITWRPYSHTPPCPESANLVFLPEMKADFLQHGALVKDIRVVCVEDLSPRPAGPVLGLHPDQSIECRQFHSISLML